MKEKTHQNKKQVQELISFSNNRLLTMLFGESDANLARIEEKLGVNTSSRGNKISISGDEHNVEIARNILESLYQKLEKGLDVGPTDVDAAIRLLSPNTSPNVKGGKKANGKHYESDIVLKTQRKHIFPYSRAQENYMRSLLKNELTFAIGPAGTGKTYLAVACAVSMFLEKKVDRIILSRPAVEAGEKLGFLPGDLKDKVDPYLRPLYDALYDMMPSEKVVKSIENAEIEIAPLGFMRGRTLSHSFVILDEAQNATPTQMKMFLTRLGQGSRMAVCGDLSQTDLPGNMKSGLRDAIEKLIEIDEVEMIRFHHQDIVRHELTIKIVEAYEKADKKEKRKNQSKPEKDSNA